MECEGCRRLPRNRTKARWRHRWRLDGARHQEHRAIAARGSRKHGGIFEVVAAGRGAAAAEEGQGRRKVVTEQAAARYPGVKAAVIGMGRSGTVGTISNGLRGAGVAFLLFFESVLRLGRTISANGRLKSPTLYRTMPRSK